MRHRQHRRQPRRRSQLSSPRSHKPQWSPPPAAAQHPLHTQTPAPPAPSLVLTCLTLILHAPSPVLSPAFQTDEDHPPLARPLLISASRRGEQRSHLLLHPPTSAPIPPTRTNPTATPEKCGPGLLSQQPLHVMEGGALTSGGQAAISVDRWSSLPPGASCPSPGCRPLALYPARPTREQANMACAPISAVPGEKVYLGGQTQLSREPQSLPPPTQALTLPPQPIPPTGFTPQSQSTGEKGSL